MYDGSITGVNELLEENKKIVQKWKFSNWKEFADLTLTFKERSGNECEIFVNMKNILERDNMESTIDLKVVENGWRQQIFQKIYNFLGYPINGDVTDSDEEDN